MSAENLVLTDRAGEESADMLLASLSDIAYSVPAKQDTIPEGRRSRFFYKPTKSIKEELEERKVQFAPKKLEHIDATTEERLITYREELPETLKTNLENIREFFLTQISPLTFAAPAGTSQAKDVAQRLLGTEIDNTVFDKFERMVHTATTLKLAVFVTNYMGLPKSATRLILESITPAARDPKSEMSELISALEKYATSNATSNHKHIDKRNGQEKQPTRAGALR